MGLKVKEISEFVKEEMQKTFNEKFDIKEDGIEHKVHSILNGEVGDEYFSDFCDEMLDTIIENIIDMNLQDLKKDAEGNIVEDLDEKTKKRIKELISLRFIIFYNNIKHVLRNTEIKKMIKKILDDEEI